MSLRLAAAALDHIIGSLHCYHIIRAHVVCSASYGVYEGYRDYRSYNEYNKQVEKIVQVFSIVKKCTSM